MTEEVPFKISIVEPKVPLVQNGSMNLKVVVERKPGFTGAITTCHCGIRPAQLRLVGDHHRGSDRDDPAAQRGRDAQAHNGRQPWSAWPRSATVRFTSPRSWRPSRWPHRSSPSPWSERRPSRARTPKSSARSSSSPRSRERQGSAVGLPNTATAGEMEITKDTKERTLKTTVRKTTPAGQHRNLLCQTSFMLNGEPVIFDVGGGELASMCRSSRRPRRHPPRRRRRWWRNRPDPADPPEKRLTRLEKLRLEQEEREKVAGAAVRRRNRRSNSGWSSVPPVATGGPPVCSCHRRAACGYGGKRIRFVKHRRVAWGTDEHRRAPVQRLKPNLPKGRRSMAESIFLPCLPWRSRRVRCRRGGPRPDAPLSAGHFPPEVNLHTSRGRQVFVVQATLSRRHHPATSPPRRSLSSPIPRLPSSTRTS